MVTGRTKLKSRRPLPPAISLRIFHPDINPKEITARLGLTPKLAQMKGQRRITPKGTLLKGNYEKSYWIFELKVSSKKTIAENLSKFLTLLEKKESAMVDLADLGARAEFFIGIFLEDKNFWEEMNWKLLERLGRMRISLSLDIYS